MTSTKLSHKERYSLESRKEEFDKMMFLISLFLYHFANVYLVQECQIELLLFVKKIHIAIFQVCFNFYYLFLICFLISKILLLELEKRKFNFFVEVIIHHFLSYIQIFC